MEGLLVPEAEEVLKVQDRMVAVVAVEPVGILDPEVQEETEETRLTTEAKVAQVMVVQVLVAAVAQEVMDQMAAAEATEAVLEFTEKVQMAPEGPQEYIPEVTVVQAGREVPVLAKRMVEVVEGLAQTLTQVKLQALWEYAVLFGRALMAMLEVSHLPVFLKKKATLYI